MGHKITFRQRLNQGLIFFDGAMGTQLQGLNLRREDWHGYEGCSEILNRLVPESIVEIHRRYLSAGAEVIETNSFGANAVVLADYGLHAEVEEFNRLAAELARRAIHAHQAQHPESQRTLFVAGSMGPGTKLPSLGHIDFASLHASYRRQAQGLAEGGVDLFLIETCQDLLQIKAALLACHDVNAALGCDLPIAVTVTVETTGTLLMGSEIDAVIATLEPFDVDILGMNCATGPESMRPYVRRIAAQFKGRILVQPNAGLPQNIDGEMCYPLQAEDFAQAMLEMIRDEGIELAGGCCGTTPAHIQALTERIGDVQPKLRNPQAKPSVASLFKAQELDQDPKPFLVGERSNANGSRAFLKRLLNEDWDGIVDIAAQQAKGGAHALDVCVAATGRDEKRDMSEVLPRIATRNTLPIIVDSTNVEVLEEALQILPGRAIINSVNLEAGEAHAEKICRLAKRYGAALVALTIDEQGMAKTVQRKREVATRLHAIAVERCGLRSQDLIFDALTFTLGSGDPSLRDAGINTLEGLRLIKQDLPGVWTLLGLSNISFGLNPGSREVLNAVFLDEAVKAGLDLAIVNPARIVPIFKIEPRDQELARDLIFQRGEGDPLLRFIEHFADEHQAARDPDEEKNRSLDERIRAMVVDGTSKDLEPLITRKLDEASALEIVNGLLIPAMKKVGELFGAGQMQLPFVLQSAEVMKQSVAFLEPHMERREDQRQRAIVLATVRGDVHDIGKNLVEIILSNNGYKVHNLGINCEVSRMIEVAEAEGADAIGMSGLLVKSTVVMKDNLDELRRRGVQLPVLLGGAALTPSFVAEQCAPALDAPVLYCSDAFAGLQAMAQLDAGTLAEAAKAQAARVRRRPKPREESVLDSAPEALLWQHEIPTPPYWGRRVVTPPALEPVFAMINELALFRGRWGYKRGSLSDEAFAALTEGQVRSEYNALKQRCVDEKILQPAISEAFYSCNSVGETVEIYASPDSDEVLTRFAFPRQRKAPGRSLADFFLPKEGGRRDLIALQVVTVGPRVSELELALYQDGHYKDYLLLHGLAVETAEALAEYWHQQVRARLNMGDESQLSLNDLYKLGYRGARYSFGYPACPDLDLNAPLLKLLDADAIGVTLTDNSQMVPEQSTSAFIVHHPQAKYFAV